KAASYATGLDPQQASHTGEDVLVVDNQGSQLLRVRPDGSVIVVATNLHQPFGVAVSGDQIFVTNNRGQLLDISPSGQVREIANLGQPLWGITVDPQGDIWVVKHNNVNRIFFFFNNLQRIGSLSRISSTGLEQMIASGIRAPYGVGLRSGDPVVITDRQLLWFKPTRQVVVDGLVNGRGLAARGSELWFSDRDPSTGEGRLRRVSLAGAVEEITIPEMQWPLSIAVTEDGALRVADGSGRLSRLVQ
ncbi:MAG: hypothetical protein HC924_06405, partial [Synechococcaceae cyanobacterium SM2_3_2]|nr:hypothetical protein [Synechococcaceae cyanobacterium SM2_3_2]